MAEIIFDNVSKIYPGKKKEAGQKAVSDLSLRIEDGDFVVLVGPSGCGKTTALRMIAGLEDISEGTITIGDRIVNDLDPGERDIAMVFQNYALYPHMSVFENIAFPLRCRKVPKDQIKKRVEEVAAMLDLSNYLQRKPRTLSGGQRQRVAMGRALVREPQAFLMDEPLSNLDAKLRVQMRSEICNIQKKTGITTVYVTHDQVEAMTMGSKIAILRFGMLQQYDTPLNVFNHPANIFVAGFIGSPSMNFIKSKVIIEQGRVCLILRNQKVCLNDSILKDIPSLEKYDNEEVILGIRPEHIVLNQDNGYSFKATIDRIELLGAEQLIYAVLDADEVSIDSILDDDSGGASKESDEAIHDGMVHLVIKQESGINFSEGKEIDVSWRDGCIHFFDPKSGVSII